MLMNYYRWNALRDAKNYVCRYCGKDFAAQADSDSHWTREERTREIECEICEHKTSTRAHMREHMKTHSEEKHMPAECAKPPTNISAHFVGTTGRNTNNVYNVFCSQLTCVHERKLTVCRYYFHAVFMLYIFVTVVRLFSQTLNTTCNILKYLVVPYYYYTSNSRLHLNKCTIKGPVIRSLTFTWRLN